MKLILSAVAFFSCSVLYAQERIEVNGKTRINLDSFVNNKQSAVVQYNKMPNALQGFKDNQQLLGNNQQGFDVYQSQVDNMNVLKPDANNAAQFKMPIWNYKSENGDVYSCFGGPIEPIGDFGDILGKPTYKPKIKKFKLLQLDDLPAIK